MADELTPNERKRLDAWQPMEPPADFVDRVSAARAWRRGQTVAGLAAGLVAAAAVVVVVLRPGTQKYNEQTALAPVADAGILIHEERDASLPAVILMDAHQPLRLLDAALPPPVHSLAEIDLQINAGESATIHDPLGAPLVRFSFGRAPLKCPNESELELSKEPGTRFGVTGLQFADHTLDAGIWSYNVRCLSNGKPGAMVARGRIVVRKDAGTRPLPKDAPVNSIAADGRSYRISYQNVIPTVVVNLDKPGTLHLARGGREQTFTTTTTRVVLRGDQLLEGTYTYWVEGGKVSTVILSFDQTAPQVHLELPPEAGTGTWPDPIEVRGGVVAGWSARVASIEVPINDGRFAARVPVPDTRALAIKLTHPRLGTHYYLRRP